MVQIKFSVAFVLAAAAIAPVHVLALPVTLKNRSVLYGAISNNYFLLIVYHSAELNTRDEFEIFERSSEHFE